MTIEPPASPPPYGVAYRIEYLAPLERAFGRMKDLLFRPFDLARWMVLGFTAWLASFVEGGSNGSIRLPSGGDWNLDDTDAATAPLAGATSLGSDFPDELLEPGVLGCLIVFVVLFVLVVLPVLLWLGSRGQFMFLDNLVHGRAEVKRPWAEFRREGNSLFFWYLLFIVVALVTLVIVALPGGMLLFTELQAEPHSLPGAGLLTLFVPFTLWAVALGYVGFLLRAFVVPIMHRERLTTNQAWRVFLPVFRERWGSFLVVGLFVVALWMAVAIAIVAGGLATCCILFIVLVIPYIGTVALLPISVTYRAFTLEFLAQFSPRFEFFPVAAAPAGTALPPIPPPPSPPPV